MRTEKGKTNEHNSTQLLPWCSECNVGNASEFLNPETSKVPKRWLYICWTFDVSDSVQFSLPFDVWPTKNKRYLI